MNHVNTDYEIILNAPLAFCSVNGMTKHPPSHLTTFCESISRMESLTSRA